MFAFSEADMELGSSLSVRTKALSPLVCVFAEYFLY